MSPFLGGFFLTVKNISSKVHYQFLKTKQYLGFTIFFTLCLYSSYSIAQGKHIQYTNQQWFQYFNVIRFSQKWSLLTDGGYRLKDEFRKSSQYIIRSAMGYYLNSGTRIAVGFAHLGFYDSDKLNKLEFRPYQEIVMKQKYQPIGINNRFRIEERVLRTVNREKNGNSFHFRFRYRVLISLPILRFSSTNPDKKLFLSIGDEIFINAGKEIVYNIFDQNRIAIGTSVHFNKNTSAGFAYNYQFAATSSPELFKRDNIFWFDLRHTIHFSKKK